MRQAKVTAFFGDAEYLFKLGMDQCIELQDTFDMGLMETLERVTLVAVKDVKAVIRLGLIGGGMKPEGAFALVQRHVREGELVECADLAAKIVRAALSGPKDEDLGEPKGETSESLSPAAKSATAISTESPAPPA